VLTSIPGLGPKRVHVLHEALGIRTIEDLLAAAEAGRVRVLPRFSIGLERKIIEEIRRHRETEPRFKISTAEDFAAGLVAHLRAAPGAGEVVVAGSFRRRKETVGDLDIVVTAKDGKSVTDHFVAYDEVGEVVSHGTTRASAILKAGLQVDLRVVPRESYGAALHYFTGSKAHNIAVRTLAQERGLKLNEYGIFRGDEPIGGRTEEEVFRAAGLPYIEPELRELRGEIEAAREGRLPKLVALGDIRGDLHVHTKASDGKNTIAEMAEAARALGYEYVAIADHSRHATVAHGLDPARLALELDEIDGLNDRLEGFLVLKACEVDILADGTLDLPDAVLRRLDLRICAIHYRFELDREKQTERVLRAMDNRYSTSSPTRPDGSSASGPAMRSISSACCEERKSAAAFSSLTPIRAASTSTTCTAGWPRISVSGSPSPPTPIRRWGSAPCASASARPAAAGSRPATS
jgi:DNA polymerase (family X)